LRPNCFISKEELAFSLLPPKYFMQYRSRAVFGNLSHLLFLDLPVLSFHIFGVVAHRD
jgi:hypothetical protein